MERKNAHHMFLRASFYFLSFIFACLVVYMLFFSVEMQITKIEVTGTKELDNSELMRMINEDLQSATLGFLPKNNYILVSNGRIEKLLSDKYKKIRSVKVEKKFPDTIVANVDERDSLLVWCQQEDKCFLLDEDSIAYSVADFNSPELTQNKLLRINDRSNSDVFLGSSVIKKSYEEYVLSAKDEFGKLGINIENNFYVPSRMAEEMEIRSVDGFSILLSSQFTLNSAIKTLDMVLKKEITKEKITQLEYIDLRSEYKAFYKYKNSGNAEQQNNEQQNQGADDQKK